MRTVADLEPGMTGILEDLKGEPDCVARFSGLGLLPGVELRLHKRAPLGDPIAIEFEGQILSLRLQEARNLLLEPLKPLS